MISPVGIPVDLIPFGAIEDKHSCIQWPPKGDNEMNMLGFQEAHEHAVKVIIQMEPLIEVPVATSQGLALLKVIAWSDRNAGLRKKDAGDLAYLLETYELIDGVSGRLYEMELMERYEWDATIAGARLLGFDAALITQEETKKQISNILENNLSKEPPNFLVEEMCEEIENEDYEKKFNLLKAFASGFNE